MKQEKIILSFVAVLIGLLVAGAAFYFYQSTKVIKPDNKNVFHVPSPTPKPKPEIFLNIDEPQDESVTANKTLSISGKTNPDATVIIITAANQEIIQPSSQGNFSTTITLDEGENLIDIRAITPEGESQSVKRTVTYSTQNF